MATLAPGTQSSLEALAIVLVVGFTRESQKIRPQSPNPPFPQSRARPAHLAGMLPAANLPRASAAPPSTATQAARARLLTHPLRRVSPGLTRSPGRLRAAPHPEGARRWLQPPPAGGNAELPGLWKTAQAEAGRPHHQTQTGREPRPQPLEPRTITPGMPRAAPTTSYRRRDGATSGRGTASLRALPGLSAAGSWQDWRDGSPSGASAESGGRLVLLGRQMIEKQPECRQMPLGGSVCPSSH